MTINTIQDLPANKLALLGPNFIDWFGDVDLTGNPADLEFAALPKPMTGQAIYNTGRVVPCQLLDAIFSLRSIQQNSLFFITDGDGELRVVFVFRNGANWNVIARNPAEPEKWFGNVNVYSLKQN